MQAQFKHHAPRTLSFVRFAASVHLALMFATGCANADLSELDAAGPGSVGSELHGPKPALEPDYTAQELEALAASPEVEQMRTPFRNAPAPDQTLYVAMSDGVRIALSLYFPAGIDLQARRAPTAYLETWYTRAEEVTGNAVDLYRAAGFVVAVADPRGFATSFGSQPTYLSELQRNDQREMIAWLAARPWSNGQVAPIGVSVSAMLAESMLASGAPSVKAGIVRATEWDQYSQNMFPGGVPNEHMHQFIEFIYSWMRGEPCLADAAACPEIGIPAMDGDADFTQLRAALRDHQQNIAPDAMRGTIYSDDRIAGSTFDDVSPKGRLAELRKYAIPARVSASWFDGTTAQAALERFNALPGVPMQVSIGATTHLGGLNADPFEREAFTLAQPDPATQFGNDIAFLKRALNGEPVGRGIEYYVLGADVWKTSDVWPPSGVKRETLRLTRDRLQNVATRRAGERAYQVDPTTSTGARHNRWASQNNAAIYYGDRRFDPGQTLQFDGAALHANAELVGAAELCLVMRSDQPDGTVIAYLEDVAPDGRTTYLTEGLVRLLHRKTARGGCDSSAGTERSFKAADGAAVVPGELMHVEIPFLPVAARIERGHRLRLSLAGADAGTFGTLTDVPANWSVAYGGAAGSSLSLPLKPWSRAH